MEAGLQKDDVVMAQMPNCWELAMLYLAVSRAGGILSPVPMQWRAKEIGYVAELTEAKPCSRWMISTDSAIWP